MHYDEIVGIVFVNIRLHVGNWNLSRFPSLISFYIYFLYIISEKIYFHTDTLTQNGLEYFFLFVVSLTEHFWAFWWVKKRLSENMMKNDLSDKGERIGKRAEHRRCLQE